MEVTSRASRLLHSAEATNTATTRSPQSSSGMPTTAASLTLLSAGCSDHGRDEIPAAQAPQEDAPGAVDATPSGAIEVTVTYDGSPVIETLRVNKDVEQCGPTS